MNKKELEAELKNVFGGVLKEMNGANLEPVKMWLGHKVTNVFEYGAISERCMERQLAETSGRERKTTFMSDLSIGEWCESWRGVFDTTRRAITEWRDNIEYIAEFVLCVNWKAWEHHARGNENWAKFYSLLFEGVRDVMYDYYEGDEEKTSYLWQYLD